MTKPGARAVLALAGVATASLLAACSDEQVPIWGDTVAPHGGGVEGQRDCRLLLDEARRLRDANNTSGVRLAIAVGNLDAECPAEHAIFAEEVALRMPQAEETATPTAGRLDWRQAAFNAGQLREVCGPVAGEHSAREGIVLDIGQPAPHPARFTILVRQGGDNPPERGVTVCASGSIALVGNVGMISVATLDDVTRS